MVQGIASFNTEVNWGNFTIGCYREVVWLHSVAWAVATLQDSAHLSKAAPVVISTGTPHVLHSQEAQGGRGGGGLGSYMLYLAKGSVKTEGLVLRTKNTPIDTLATSDPDDIIDPNTLCTLTSGKTILIPWKRKPEGCVLIDSRCSMPFNEC